MTKNELKEEYIRQLNLSKINLDGLDSRTRFTQEGVVNSAKQKILKLEPEVMSGVLKDSTLVVVSNDANLDSVVNDIAATNGNILVIDAMSLEKMLLSLTFNPKVIKGFPFNSTTVSMINNAMLELRTFLGASYIQPINIPASKYKIFDEAGDALMYLSELIKDTFGDELKNHYINKQIGNFVSSNLLEFDKMVFFLTNTNDQHMALKQSVGKFTTVSKSDGEIETAQDLQKLISTKLKKK